MYRHFQYKYPFTSNYNTSASKLPQKSFPLEYDRMVGSRIPIWTRSIIRNMTYVVCSLPTETFFLSTKIQKGWRDDSTLHNP